MIQIIESKKLSDLQRYVKEDTLVIFDIDNTLTESTSNIGNIAWLDHIMKNLLNKGLSKEEALKRQYDLWVQVQPFISVKTIEKNTAEIIKQLQHKSIKTMGLTGRGSEIAQITTNQLKSVDITLGNNTIHNYEVVLSRLACFLDGVLSIEFEGNKGTRLIEFFDTIKYTPSEVLFVDDTRHHLESVQKALIPKNIPFTGIHYTAATTQQFRFDPAQAKKELKTIRSTTKMQAPPVHHLQ